MSQMSQAFYGFVDSLWVSKTIGKDGMTVFGAVFVVDFIAASFANYFGAGLTARTSYLFGKKMVNECSQLYVDFIRICLFTGILVPLLVLPIVKPIIMWFGADQKIADMSFIYMIPSTVGSFITFLFMIGCGLIQATGRSTLYGVIQLVAFVLNMLVFDPLLLYYLKTPMWGASLATILSQLFPAIFVTIRIFSGKYAIQPKMKMFLKPISKETWAAMSVGFSSWIASVSLTIPQVLMQKYFNNASLAIGEYNTMIMIWAVMEKLYLITGGICVAFGQSTLPSVSFAFGANRLNRVLRIGLHALWVSTMLSCAFAGAIILFPRKIAKIWSSDPHYLNWAEKTIPVMFYCAPFFAIQYIIPAVLQGMKKVFSSTALSILTLLIPLPVFSSLLYFTNKRDPIRIIYTFTCNDIYSFIMCILFSIIPFKELWIAEPSADAISQVKSNYTDRDELLFNGSDVDRVPNDIPI